MDLDEILAIILIPATVIGVLVGVCIGAAYWSNSAACNNMHRLTGLETDMSIGLGCMVKYEGRWVDASVVTSRKQEITVRPAP